MSAWVASVGKRVLTPTMRSWNALKAGYLVSSSRDGPYREKQGSSLRHNWVKVNYSAILLLCLDCLICYKHLSSAKHYCFCCSSINLMVWVSLGLHSIPVKTQDALTKIISGFHVFTHLTGFAGLNSAHQCPTEDINISLTNLSFITAKILSESVPWNISLKCFPQSNVQGQWNEMDSQLWYTYVLHTTDWLRNDWQNCIYLK